MRSARQARSPSARHSRTHSGMHTGRRGRSSLSLFKALVVVCFVAAFFVFCVPMFYEVRHLPAEQQLPPAKALRGDKDDALLSWREKPPPPAGGGEQVVAPDNQRPNQGGGNGNRDTATASSSEAGSIDLEARGVGKDQLRPPTGDDGPNGEGQDEWEGGEGVEGKGNGGIGDGGGGDDARGEAEDLALNSLTAPSDDAVDPAAGEDGSEARGGDPGQEPEEKSSRQDRPAVGGERGGGVQVGRGGGGILDGSDPDLEQAIQERRSRLNGLVDAAVARQADHGCNVAFIKTHKTASTTLTAVLYRYGLRHSRRVARFKVEGTAVVLEHAAKETAESGHRVEIFHYHHVWDGYFKSTWEMARTLFKDIMAEPVVPAAGAAVVPGGGSMNGGGTKFVTVLRDPVEHWLSYFYFYYQPEMKVDVEEYFQSGRHKNRPLSNPMAAEFGIYSEGDLDEFILNHLSSFALIMLTEEVDEGLVLLGKILDWDPIDLTYASLLEARDGATRWDGKPIKKAPRPKDLQPSTLSELARVTKLDAALYEAAKVAYGEVKALHSEGLEEAVAEFRGLEIDVLEVLSVDRGGQVSPAREWYTPESDYYFYSADKSRWGEAYYPGPIPF